MKAWEMEKLLIEGSKPKVLTEEEQTWAAIEALEAEEDRKTRLMWYSEVPGSGARERLIIGAIQDVGNRGRSVEKAESLIEPGLEAYNSGDMVKLNIITSKIFYELNHAEKDQSAPYWRFKEYTSWEEYLESVSLPEKVRYDVSGREYEHKIFWGWMAQICGGAFGTALEGYTTANLRSAFSEIRDYIREPNTFNDDITYELAFLKAFEREGYHTTSADIAEEWIGYIPFGWSAEDIALRNIKYGIYPPESGFINNPFYEWIGAQMRGAICGMVAPGDPKEAARLAWADGAVSHYNNGILGEIFNALLVSLAFIEKDVRKILEQAIEMIPKDSEYYSVVRYAQESCLSGDSWEVAWAACERKYERYNWIHAYPNAAAEVVALWYGNGDFDETMHIIAMEGQDVDCNAAQIATALGIILGPEGITEKWTGPIGDDLDTYVRQMKKMKISELAKWTVEVVRKAHKGE